MVKIIIAALISYIFLAWTTVGILSEWALLYLVMFSSYEVINKW